MQIKYIHKSFLDKRNGNKQAYIHTKSVDQLVLIDTRYVIVSIKMEGIIETKAVPSVELKKLVKIFFNAESNTRINVRIKCWHTFRSIDR